MFELGMMLNYRQRSSFLSAIRSKKFMVFRDLQRKSMQR